MPYLIFILRCIKNKVKVRVNDSKLFNSLFTVLLRNTSISSTGERNSIEASQAIVINSSIEIIGNSCQIIIGKGTLLDNCKIWMSGNNQKLIIKEGCRIRNTSFWLEDGKNLIQIGKGLTCEGAHIAATEPSGKIELGDDCMLSYDIDIRNGDSHVILSEDGSTRLNYPEDVKIASHVWIGAHSRILKGSVISENCIVGTGTILSNIEIEPNSLVAGVPGKVIKSKVNWGRDRTSWIRP